ncbi:glycosyltransferase family 4 protein [Candidatus Peregrinibacteria bacterium]|jgi:glycosyltransferase involved in cell wall biosynthesis|nr:glycosyltransferase family 4 protein [Candidatus Peregrinibacteria bacterium]MBT4148151.1 glycosyltransferase family 4 protein [Candidatus Peregrinibacteria bacterium]MBT4366638.1 glycosyltransferase family 4 protein [Candidatus Peregrinibacteria bacterium]MBT4455625.1 glycosyltransferase family 4 protein [Candidatus Peregrinibacteria bacterium]
MATNQKNILLFTDTPLKGGAELQMYLLAKFLDREKFNPIVCCGPSPTLDNWVANLENEDIRVIRLEIKHKNDPSQLKQLKSIIKEEKIDLLHIHVWNPASGRFALLAGKRTKTPIITTEHDPFKLNPIKNTIKKSLLKHVSKIITVSKQNQTLLQDLYPDQKHKISVIHNGIDTTWWKSQIISFGAKDRTNIRKELFESDTKTLVGLTVAELHPRKGLHFLLRAIQNLLTQLPATKSQNIRFAIAGEGPQREALQKLIEKRNLQNHVILLGRRKNIPQLMKSADFFVLPSTREAFGLVNLEAMISNLPIIATKAGGIPEIIENNKTGLLVPTENEKLLAQAIKKLISSKPLRDRLAKNAKKTVEKTFDAHQMAKKYERIYTSVL